MIYRNSRNLLWVVPLALFLTSPLWKPALTDFLQPRGEYETSSRDADEPVQNFIMDVITITLSNKGRVEWVVNAQQAFTGQTDKEIGMIDVDALYTDQNNDNTHITSSEGMYDVDKRHLILIDNVVIRKPAAGQEMFTELLHYYDAVKMAISPGDVEITGPKYTIEAGRLDYNLATNAYDFSKRVKVDL
ncbi:MAG: LPS export ABC transporter periplasmic protein LptC [Desulfobulbaceae bacterium]|nr:LPS export ABC transporter periplasmic protein LptC [Desulfobulbaceae bacterium]